MAFNKNNSDKHQVAVVVLGDIGHSPRMTYHSLSLAQEGFTVNLVGYHGSQPRKAVRDEKNIHLYYLPDTPSLTWLKPKFLQYVAKVLIQSFMLLYYLMIKIPKVSHFLLQNPPTIPAFYIIWFVSLWHRAKFIIDWHNFGYTILSLSLGSRHPFVRINRWIEMVFGHKANNALCVSKAMQQYLATEWNITNCTLLYDRPDERFKPLRLEDKHKLLTSLSQRFPQFLHDSNDLGNAITEVSNDGTAKYCANRPALIISSTSWTEDEDFSILLSSLKMYNRRKCEEEGTSLPRVICCITGKGPLKDYYKDKIECGKLDHVDIVLPWLSAEEYAGLLGSADLGVCLHTSSSGLDLPMKVVDMFGSGLPVCAINYKCIEELVQHDHNGLIFNTDKELFTQFVTLLQTFHTNQAHLMKYRENVHQFQQDTWHRNWMNVALPIFK